MEESSNSEEEKLPSKSPNKKGTSLSYKQMVVSALLDLSDRKGSTLQTINRFIESNFDVPQQFKRRVKLGLEKAIEAGLIFKRDAYRYKIIPYLRQKLLKGTDISEIEKTPTPSKRGRTTTTSEKKSQSKDSSPSSSYSSSQSRSPSKSPSKASSNQVSTPRKRGRPRKNPKPEDVEQSDSVPNKRARGRPRKNSPHLTPSGRKRGRPRKDSKISENGDNVAESVIARVESVDSRRKTNSPTKLTKRKLSHRNSDINKNPPKKSKKDPSISSTIELVISVDTTSTMSSVLKELSQNSESIFGPLIQDIPSLRVAIVAHGFPDDEPFSVKHSKFTSDTKEIVSFFRSELNSKEIYRIPEAYELALRQVRKLPWSKGPKVLIFLGDSTIQWKDEKCGRHDWRKELSKLSKMRVKAYPLLMRNEEDQHPSQPDANEFRDSLASATPGGLILELSHPLHILDAIRCIGYREAAEVQKRIFENKIQDWIASDEMASVVIPPEIQKNLSPLTLSDFSHIHSAIRSSADEIEVMGNSHPILSVEGCCRFISFKSLADRSITLLALDGLNEPEKNNYQITWIVSQGKWGYIIERKGKR